MGLKRVKSAVLYACQTLLQWFPLPLQQESSGQVTVFSILLGYYNGVSVVHHADLELIVCLFCYKCIAHFVQALMLTLVQHSKWKHCLILYNIVSKHTLIFLVQVLSPKHCNCDF